MEFRTLEYTLSKADYRAFKKSGWFADPFSSFIWVSYFTIFFIASVFMALEYIAGFQLRHGGLIFAMSGFLSYFLVARKLKNIGLKSTIGEEKARLTTNTTIDVISVTQMGKEGRVRALNKFEWKNIRFIQSTHDHFFLGSSKIDGIVIPKNAFRDDTEAENFWEQLVQACGTEKIYK